MFKKINKHMEKQKENPAEHFRPSQEDKFPKLTEMYWANPNSQRGVIEICSYKSGLPESERKTEGV